MTNVALWNFPLERFYMILWNVILDIMVRVARSTLQGLYIAIIIFYACMHAAWGYEKVNNQQKEGDDSVQLLQRLFLQSLVGNKK